MKYIVKGRRGWNHEAYWNYLDSVEGLMPKHVFEFANSSDSHNLTSPNSLHDSWLESWLISERTESESRADRCTQIEARLLGPRHDRYIHLKYGRVESHSIRNSGIALPSSRRSPHGDLLVHELTIVRDGLFSHELVFAEGSVFEVSFADFECEIVMIQK
jgi:hypothetical protein